MEVRCFSMTVQTLTRSSRFVIKEARIRQDQILKAYSFSLDTAKESAAALDAACEPHGGRAPDAVFACAGASKPMFLVEMDEQDFHNGMTMGYWVQAWTAFVR
jgi:3-dehydrosphinganine reductase